MTTVVSFWIIVVVAIVFTDVIATLMAHDLI